MTANGKPLPLRCRRSINPRSRRARPALTLLLLINLFNYIDRQVMAAVEPHVRREFFPKVEDPATGEMKEPANAKFWTGVLSFGFLVTYMLMAPVFGFLANRVRRWLLVGIGVAIWSLASGASGLAIAYSMMFAMRCFVGVGEAAYGPIAPDMISDLYPVKKRGRILAWFYAAIPFGGALGYALGSLTIRFSGDWRVAFYLVVPPGLVLGLWCFLMPEPRRGQVDLAAASGPKATLVRLPDPAENSLLRPEHARHDGHDLRHRRPGLVDARLSRRASR